MGGDDHPARGEDRALGRNGAPLSYGDDAGARERPNRNLVTKVQPAKSRLGS